MHTSPRSYNIDKPSIILFISLILLGWINIFATEYNPNVEVQWINLDTSTGKQAVWIFMIFLLASFTFFLDHKLFDYFAYIFFAFSILLLLAVLIFGKEVSGTRSWIGIGSLGIQPSEFAKYATALALAKYVSNHSKKLNTFKVTFLSLLCIFTPFVLIILQGDPGTAIVFSALLIPLYREGMSPILLILGFGVVMIVILTLIIRSEVLYVSVGILTIFGIGFFSKEPQRIVITIFAGLSISAMIGSVDFILYQLLKPHQQKRILSLVNPDIDPLGVGWNVMQSKIAIGSGGFSGKGFLQGTQTKFDFVPEQTTDFIFSTVGEEHGWLGCMLVIILFTALLLRILHLAERQKSIFYRIFGYAVLSILFFHFAINVAMTTGLLPVIGIPLPFFSYGGSSLLTFSAYFFTFLKFDAVRMSTLERI